MKRLFSSFFIMIFVISSFCKAQYPPAKEINTYAVSSLDSLLLESISSKRITLLADNYHGHFSYENLVAHFLNFWLDSRTNNKSDNKIASKLVLFLEVDSVYMHHINKVIKSGNVNDFIKYNIEQVIEYGGWEKCTVDRIHFILELGSIVNRIKNINSRTKTLNIDLQIVSAESVPPPDSSYTNIPYERFLWFVKERDKLSSKNICFFLERNPDYKALIFYGGAHLIRYEFDKRPFSPVPLAKPVKDFFLTHYLDQYFGRQQVSAFSTASSSQEIGSNKQIKIIEYEPKDYSVDFNVCYKIIPTNPFPIYFLKNRTVLKSIIELVQEYKQKIGHLDFSSIQQPDVIYSKKIDYALYVAFTRIFFNQVKRSSLYLNPLLKNKIDSLAYYPLHAKDQDWAFNNTFRISQELVDNFDFISDIEKMNDWIIPKYKFVDSLLYYQSLKSIIYNLPPDTTDEVFQNEIKNSSLVNTLTNFEKDQIAKRINELKIYTAINALWVNDDAENKKYFQYLSEKTGCNFGSREEWFDWWMKRYR